jgi:hypothetical protein
MNSGQWRIEHPEGFPRPGAKRNKPQGLRPAVKQRMTSLRVQSAHLGCHLGQPRLRIALSRLPCYVQPRKIQLLWLRLFKKSSLAAKKKFKHASVVIKKFISKKTT